MTLIGNLNDSASDFQRLVWPALGRYLGGGRIVHVETITETAFARDLDFLTGIDAYQVTGNQRGIRGIASRVQWGPTAWRTFTVRRSTGNGGKTEYAKRKDAIESGRGLLYPHLTIQAYVSGRPNGRLLAAAAVRTDELIAMCAESRVRTTPADGSTFYWVPWSEFSTIVTADSMPERHVAA